METIKILKDIFQENKTITALKIPNNNFNEKIEPLMILDDLIAIN